MKNKTIIIDTMDTLGDRMKSYEELTNQHIPPTSPFIVRLDGTSFSNFTRPLKKPFDHNFTLAMVSTMNDLVDKFSARTGYCHSDEITLIFPAATTLEEYEKEPKKFVHMYDGRVQKICSVFAAYCSVRFNHYLKIYMKPEEYNEKIIEKMHADEASFDARIMIMPNETEIVNHMIWRSCRDCPRNAVSTYGQYYYSHKELDKKTTDEKIVMLATKGVDWDKDVPMHLKHGVYGKKELYEKEVEIDGKTIKAMRSRVVNKCFRIECTPECTKLMMDKMWTDIPIIKIDF